MAKINPIRRAEIGREKRARTRAQLVSAAYSLFGRQPVESLTVDDVVKEAQVAKGTFYVHFDDLQALTTAMADELIKSIDDLLQPGRLSLSKPASRIAFGCCGFIDKALTDPVWAKVMARMTAPASKAGEMARRHLFEDLSELSKGLHGSISPALNLEIVAGIIIQLLGAFAEGRLSWRDRDPAIAAILRAIGVDARQARSALALLPPPREAALPAAPRKSSRPHQRPGL
jgi:AcrR family transcriptional regulator